LSRGDEGYISYPKSLCTKGGYKLEEIKKQKRAEVLRSVQDMEISQEEEIRVVKRRWSSGNFASFVMPYR